VLFLLPPEPAAQALLTRSFLSVLSLIGAAMAVPLGADAFAGEKERRSWETLLCLPVPHRRLFAGKVLGILPFPLFVGWAGQAAALALASLRGHAVPSASWFPVLLTPFLAAFVVALSVLVSLGCQSVRAAAQITGLCLLPLFPAVMLSVHVLPAHPAALAGILAALGAGAMICFALAARRLTTGSGNPGA
jgi:ABC-type transport system involved in multi-copper enzyme maturation permease subunit